MVYLNYVHNNNVVRLFTGNRVTLYSFIYVSSDFIFGKEKRDPLSLISLRIELQKCAPSYIKLFFSFF